MKKTVVLLLVLCMLLSLFAGCAEKESASQTSETVQPVAVAEAKEEQVSQEPEESPTTQIIIDSVGREVEVPVPLETCVVTLRLNNELIRACGGSSKIIAVDDNTAQDRVYFPEFDPDNTVGKHQKDLNFEKLIELHPQVLVVPYNCDYEEISAKLEPFGIKTVVISANRPDNYEVEITNVGKLFGTEEQAAKVLEFFNKNIKTVQEAIKDADMKSVYVEYLAAYDGVISSGEEDSYEIYAGVRNILNAKELNLEGGNRHTVVDPEVIVNGDPDYIVQIITPAGLVGKSGVITPPEASDYTNAYRELTSRPMFGDLRAVKNDNYMIITAFGENAAFYFPYFFTLAKMAYPEEMNFYDPQEMWREWMEDFQGIDVIEGHFVSVTDIEK